MLNDVAVYLARLFERISYTPVRELQILSREEYVYNQYPVISPGKQSC